MNLSIRWPDSRIEALVPEVLRDAGLSKARSIRREKGGVANHVYNVDDRYVARIGTRSDGAQFPKSAAILEALSDEPFAQDVVYTDFEGVRSPFNVMVCRRLPGRPLIDQWPSLDEPGRRKHVAGIADLLRRLHEFTVAEVPFFTGVSPWPVRSRAEVGMNLTLATESRSFPIDRLERLAACIQENLPGLACAPEVRLCHLDLNLENILVCDGEVTGLVDFDDADLSPPEVDVLELLHTLVGDGLVPPRTAIGWLDESFPGVLGAEGLRERFILDQVIELLWGLTQAESVSWTTPADARAESEMTWNRLFETGYYEPWFDALGCL